MRKWLVNNTSVYFFSSPGLLEHDFVKKTAREKRWSARVSRLKCTRSPRPVDRGRPQCPVSYPDNNSASRLSCDKLTAACGLKSLEDRFQSRGPTSRFRKKRRCWVIVRALQYCVTPFTPLVMVSGTTSVMCLSARAGSNSVSVLPSFCAVTLISAPDSNQPPYGELRPTGFSWVFVETSCLLWKTLIDMKC